MSALTLNLIRNQLIEFFGDRHRVPVRRVRVRIGRTPGRTIFSVRLASQSHTAQPNYAARKGKRVISRRTAPRRLLPHQQSNLWPVFLPESMYKIHNDGHTSQWTAPMEVLLLLLTWFSTTSQPNDVFRNNLGHLERSIGIRTARLCRANDSSAGCKFSVG